ncbi:thioredoxin domain-containing protein [Galbitalea sp. SE-J8]|uniref:DsbA family protein n=1 Tax=Galbitalea sp. SE-J8 TaxID=3054952 RepID=UPI00259CE9EC|nr:thioredoxin domain-containing protein [Galbitalea sp. SE-J8]MDM4763749.1 thioredoxin domain-containing protein [Galbitalea sp. SE-J8]
MTDNLEPQSTSVPRELAREKAAQIRQQHRRAERRRRWFVGIGIGVVLVAIVAIVTVSIAGAIRPDRPGPLNMLSDGIQIGSGLAAVPTTALQPDQVPLAAAPATSPDVVALRVYVDYSCAHCGEFFRANSDLLTTWVTSGAATLEVHPVATLDSKSQGYSTRAAAAAACVANYDPDRFFAFNEALFADQPDAGTGGPGADELAITAENAGVTSASAIKSCIDDSRFTAWVGDATDRALAGPLPGTDVATLTEPPLILVNGLPFTGPYDDPNAFQQFVVQAAGATFTESSTETPAPTDTGSAPAPADTPSESPTPTATDTPAG